MRVIDDRVEKFFANVDMGLRAVEVLNGFTDNSAIPPYWRHMDTFQLERGCVFTDRLDELVIVGAIGANVEGDLHGLCLSVVCSQYKDISGQRNRISVTARYV